jgi:intein/homing endonuclease
MAKVKTKFIEGAKSQKIVSTSEAEEIFGWIEKSQRYSFNKSILDTTIVISENGPISIKDLNIGDKILSPDHNNGIDTYVEVINKYDHGEQEVFEITTEDGNSITCTMEHKFLCNDGFVYPLSEILLNNLEIMCI